MKLESCPTMTIVEVNSIDQLDDYRLLWNSLHAKTRRATFFQSLDWLRTYWRHFGEQQRLKVLIVSCSGEPLGILPLVVRRERTRVGDLRVLTYPLHDWGSYFGPIGPNPTATLLAAMRYLAVNRRDWEMLDLRWVDRHGCDFDRTGNAMRRAGLSARESVWKQVALVDLEDDFETYLASRPARFRQGIRRCRRRAEERGEVRLVRHRPAPFTHGDGDPRWDLYDQCVALAKRSWQGSAPIGTTLCSPEARDYFRDAHELAARSGAVDLCVLRIGGEPVAYTYNHHHDGVVQGMRSGYDPRFRDLGVGGLILAEMIRDSFERGDRLIDLGFDYLDVKRRWLTRLGQSFRYTHYPLGSPRGQLLRVAHWARGKLRPARENAKTQQA
jgi:CelD/BcsL family acetyltransferase involved in cellulose biosynthesis